MAPWGKCLNQPPSQRDAWMLNGRLIASAHLIHNDLLPTAPQPAQRQTPPPILTAPEPCQFWGGPYTCCLHPVGNNSLGLLVKLPVRYDYLFVVPYIKFCQSWHAVTLGL